MKKYETFAGERPRSRADAPKEHAGYEGGGGASSAGEEPAAQDDGEEPAVDRFCVAVAQADGDGRARDAMSGRHGDAQLRGDHDAEHGTKHACVMSACEIPHRMCSDVRNSNTHAGCRIRRKVSVLCPHTQVCASSSNVFTFFRH